MHKDLSEEWRGYIEGAVESLAEGLFEDGESLAIAREAWLAAFDKAAEELDNDGTK